MTNRGVENRKNYRYKERYFKRNGKYPKFDLKNQNIEYHSDIFRDINKYITYEDQKKMNHIMVMFLKNINIKNNFFNKHNRKKEIIRRKSEKFRYKK